MDYLGILTLYSEPQNHRAVLNLRVVSWTVITHTKAVVAKKPYWFWLWAYAEWTGSFSPKLLLEASNCVPAK